MFDVVVESMGRPEDTQFVGFVRDEFLFDGSEYNYLATALFKRDIHGGCVVLWGVDDTSHALVGTTFDPATARVGAEELESWLLRLPAMTPQDAYVAAADGRRVYWTDQYAGYDRLFRALQRRRPDLLA
jgi:hypothetical protein